MKNKNKLSLLKRLGNKESVELSRSEVHRIVESEETVVDYYTQQILLNEVNKYQNELKKLHNFNYDLVHKNLMTGELESKELAYLLIILFEVVVHE